ncbi:MAG: hypothetical protein HGA36_01015 [Candidatus Moranbacteria bacterium]|nr:hypothetical protein [Candidatus Moranbacteria bacterium]
MPQAFGTITTVVRRRGGMDTVKEEYAEKCNPPSVFFGDRRSRQISKRHCLMQHDKGYCTSGDC